MSNIDISVIVPIYNAEKYLTRCLDSLIQQTKPEMEFILINDGSTDNSYEICKEYLMMDRRFQLVQKENGGSASARSAGIIMAKGNYISFVDSDDYVDIGYFDALFSLTTMNNADIVSANYNTDENGQIKNRKNNVASSLYEGDDLNIIYSGIIAIDLSGERTIPAALWSKLFRKDIMLSCYWRVPEEIRVGEDLALVVLCAMISNRIYVENELTACYHYAMHPEQITKAFDSHYEMRVPLLFNTIKRVNDSIEMTNFAAQFEMLVLYFTCKGFENLYYHNCEGISRSDKRIRIKYLCSMAMYYISDRIQMKGSSTERVKRMLIRLASPQLVSIVYRGLSKTKKVVRKEYI